MVLYTCVIFGTTEFRYSYKFIAVLFYCYDMHNVLNLAWGELKIPKCADVWLTVVSSRQCISAFR